MTARPLDPVSRRRLVIAVVALSLAMAAVLLAAGCSQPAIPDVPVTNDTPAILLSDKELTERTIADSEIQIKKADAVIAWFKGNASTRDDPYLPAVITKREVAYSYLSTAQDEMLKGNYALARDKAEDAFRKANESYTDAMNRQKAINGVADCRGQQTGPGIVIIFISVILTSILPALLAAYTYSLFKTILIPAVERFRRSTSRFSDYHIFAGAWIIYSAVLFLAVMTKQLSISRLSLFGIKVTITAFWSGLVILTMIMSVLVLGLVIWSIILMYLRPGQYESGSDPDTPVHSRLNITVVGEILVVIVLLLLMFFVIGFAFAIRGPFVICW